MITIALALLAAATNAGASVLQRTANLRVVEAQRTGLAGLVELTRQPLWLAGIGAVIVSFVLQAAALDTGELAEVQPLMALELPMTLLLASMVFRRGMRARTWLDIVVMTLGMVLFLLALHPSEGTPAATDGVSWAWTGATTGAVIAGLATAAHVSTGNRRAALLGIASGISFALTAAFMAATLADGLTWSLFARWQTYLVAVAGMTAVVLLQEGLQAGSLVAVQPGVTLSDPVIAVVLGGVLFQEEVRTGSWLLPEILGAVAVGWGAIQLSRSVAHPAPRDPNGGSAGAPGSGSERGPDAGPDPGPRTRIRPRRVQMDLTGKG